MGMKSIREMDLDHIFSILQQNRESIDESFWEYYKDMVPEVQQRYIMDICEYIEPCGDILSIGCGHGIIEMVMAQKYGEIKSIMGIDIMDFKIKTMNAIGNILDIEKINGSVGDAGKLDFPSGSFDIAMLIESLSHVEDRVRALKEASRVLRKGGKLFVLDLNNGANPRILYSRWRYNRKLGLIDENPVNPYQVKNTLNEIGMRNIHITSYKNGRYLKMYDETFFQKMPTWFRLLFSVGFMLKGVKR